MGDKMNERRQGTHKAVHRLAQVYADIVIAINEVEGLNLADCNQDERKHRALCILKSDRDIIQHVVDTDLGLKLIEKENYNG
jgi:hypothetical protein